MVCLPVLTEILHYAVILKVHLTPKRFIRLIESTCYSKYKGKKKIEFAGILEFLCPFKVALEVLHDRILVGSLGRRLLMTSTQEPNTMAPQSALCIYWKMEGKTDRSNIYWDLNVQVLFLKHFFFVTGVIVKFRFERLRKKLRSITVDNYEVWTYCLELWEQFAIFQATTRKTSLRTSCLYIRNWKLDTKWRTSQTKSRKENSGLLHVNTSFPLVFIARLQLSIARMYCILSRYGCSIISSLCAVFSKCFMWIKAKCVLQFSRRDDRSGDWKS